MKQYEETIELFFELKGSPESTKETCFRRIRAFSTYMEGLNRPIEDTNNEDIQQLLGHKNLKTTQIYLYMTSKIMMGIKSPLDTKRDLKDE
jgi:integrase